MTDTERLRRTLSLKSMAASLVAWPASCTLWLASCARWACHVKQHAALLWSDNEAHWQPDEHMSSCIRSLQAAMHTWRAWPLETESMTSRVLSFAHEPVSFALWFTALAASCAARLASFACTHLKPQLNRAVLQAPMTVSAVEDTL